MDFKYFFALAVAALAVTGFLVLNPYIEKTMKVNWNTAGGVDAGASGNVEITVYNPVENSGYYGTTSTGVGLVKDKRQVALSTGINFISTQDVAKTIDPTSLFLDDLTDPLTRVLEQNYDYDLVNNQKLLEKYVDKTITLKNGEENVTGKLLSFNNDNLVVQTDKGILIVKTPEQLSFPNLPEGLVTKPTVNLMLDAGKAGTHDIQLSYLAKGISWKANYVAVANADDTKVDLQGWVSVDNKAGATFKNAKLKLVAGDINLVRPAAQGRMYDYEAMSAPKASGAPQFSEETLFEYHLYDLQRPTTIKDNEIKQIGLVEARDVPVAKKFVFDSTESSKVQVKLEFNNDKKSNLGMPLPKGTVRVYKPDSSKQLQFLGEDAVDHTATDEKVKLFIGNAFDVVAERKETDHNAQSRCMREASYEVKVRNHKKEAITVDVVETLYGEWTILKQSAEGVKENAHTNVWHVSVQPNTESVLTYTARQRYC